MRLRAEVRDDRRAADKNADRARDEKSRHETQKDVLARVRAHQRERLVKRPGAAQRLNGEEKARQKRAGDQDESFQLFHGGAKKTMARGGRVIESE